MTLSPINNVLLCVPLLLFSATIKPQKHAELIAPDFQQELSRCGEQTREEFVWKTRKNKHLSKSLSLTIVLNLSCRGKLSGYFLTKSRRSLLSDNVDININLVSIKGKLVGPSLEYKMENAPCWINCPKTTIQYISEAISPQHIRQIFGIEITYRLI